MRYPRPSQLETTYSQLLFGRPMNDDDDDDDDEIVSINSVEIKLRFSLLLTLYRSLFRK